MEKSSSNSCDPRSSRTCARSSSISAPPREFRAAKLTELIEDMDRRGVPFSARSVVSSWPSEIDYLISLNVLTESGRHLLFSHQSHLDYLTAERLAREISASRRKIIAWLQQGEQSLFRRGQLRQLLLLLSEQFSIIVAEIQFGMSCSAPLMILKRRYATRQRPSFEGEAFLRIPQLRESPRPSSEARLWMKILILFCTAFTMR